MYRNLFNYLSIGGYWGILLILTITSNVVAIIFFLHVHSNIGILQVIEQWN